MLEEQFIEESLDLSNRVHVSSPSRDIHLQCVLAGLRNRAGRRGEAEKLLATAIARFGELNNLAPAERCIHLLGFGSRHLELGQFAKARQAAKQALELAELARDEQVAESAQSRQWLVWAQLAKRILFQANALDDKD